MQDHGGPKSGNGKKNVFSTFPNTPKSALTFCLGRAKFEFGLVIPNQIGYPIISDIRYYRIYDL